MKTSAFAIIACVVLSGTSVLAETGYLTKNDIAYCEENYGQYKLLGDYRFLERERRTIEARVCVHLYNDPIWDYSGSYRLERLLERGNYYVNIEIEQSRENAKTGMIPQEKKPVTDIQKAINQITTLEKKVSDLEKKLAQKDEIISEQIKVIMSLASKLKSAIFENHFPFFGMS